MAFTVFPPTPFESTEEGQLAGNDVARQHQVVRGTLSVGRDALVVGPISSPNTTGTKVGVPAVADAAVAGSSFISSLTEEITINLAGTTSDSVGNMLPANALILGVAFLVTETINNRTAYSIGDATTAARFLATGSALTAGTNGVGLAHLSGAATTLAAGPSQPSGAKLRITTSGGTQNTTGKIRVTVFYIQAVAPTA